jgi:GDP-L-fucose synthase
MIISRVFGYINVVPLAVGFGLSQIGEFSFVLAKLGLEEKLFDAKIFSIILSTSEEISIKDVVGVIVDAMNFKGNVIFDKTKPDGQFRKPSDNSKLMSYLPDFKFTPFDVGIKETVEWFEKNYPNIKQ